jgi:hypothetical protein
MASPGFAKDVPKRVNDLLSKEFPKDFKLEWKGKTNSGVECEASIVQGTKGTLGFFKSTFKGAARNVDVTSEINTEKNVRAEVTIKDELLPGLTTIVTADSNKDGSYGTFAVEFNRDNASLTASADYGKDAGSTLKGSLAVGQGKTGFVLGAIGEYFVGSPANKLQAFTVNLGYRSKEFDIVVFDRMKSGADAQKNEVGASYFHSVNADLAVGTEISFDTNNADARPKLTLGTEWRQTLDTTLKGTFDTQGLLGFSYQQRFNPRLKATLAANVDSANLSKNNVVYGVSLNFTD